MVYVSKTRFCYPFFVQKCPVLFFKKKIDRHKIIYKNLKNFLHHALNSATTHFLKKKSMEFLKNGHF